MATLDHGRLTLSPTFTLYVPPRASRSANALGSTTWDRVDLAPVVLLRGSESVLVQRAQDRLLAQARAKDPNVEVSRLEAAGYDKGQLAGLVSPSLFGEPRLIIINDLEHATDA